MNFPQLRETVLCYASYLADLPPDVLGNSFWRYAIRY